MSSKTIRIDYYDKTLKKRLFLEGNVAKEPCIYNKDFYLDQRVGLSKNCAQRLLNRIQWADSHGLRVSNCHDLESVKRKRPRMWSGFPSFFDHTSFWRFEGERWPAFCLTEPYQRTSEERERDAIEDLNGLGYQVKWFPPSEHSLHYPNSTSMIFIWHKDFFNFDDKYLKPAPL